jgi:hypothetical protein
MNSKTGVGVRVVEFNSRLATASDKVYQLLAHGRWFSSGIPTSYTTQTGSHDITEILLKVALKHQKSKSCEDTIYKYNYIKYMTFYNIGYRRLKSLKMPKRLPESVNRRRTDNTITIEKGQTSNLFCIFYQIYEWVINDCTTYHCV